MAVRDFVRQDFEGLWCGATIRDADLLEVLQVDEDGAHIDYERAGGLQWSWLTEFRGVDMPHPRRNPALGFPFSACELAAFMLDGPGWFLAEAFGGLGAWDPGDRPTTDPPSLDVSKDLSARSGLALRKAIEAYQLAVEAVGPRPLDARERVNRGGGSPVHPAKHAVQFEGWRKRMVLHLITGTKPASASAKELILDAIHRLGHHPQRLLPGRRGKPGTKGMVQSLIEDRVTPKSFNRAWEQLRKLGALRDALDAGGIDRGRKPGGEESGP